VAQATINRLRDLIRSLNYAVSIHAAEELDDDDRGNTLDGIPAEAITKIAPGGNLFVITLYRA